MGPFRYGATEAGAERAFFSVFTESPCRSWDQTSQSSCLISINVVVGEHSDELIACIGSISAAEDTGAGDIGVLDLGGEVAGVAVELELILGGIKVGDVGAPLMP